MPAPVAHLKHIKLISFDLDDTLWDNEPVIEHAVSQSLKALQTHLPKQADLAAYVLNAKAQIVKRQPYMAWDLTALRQASYAQVLRNTGLNKNTAEAGASEATAVFSRLRNNVSPFTDVKQCLPRLAKHWPIAAISNGNCNLFSLAMGEYFSFYISPLQAQCAKPDPKMYYYAADHIQLAPQQILHIGDCPHNDIDAAKQAGYQTVWCNRNEQVFTGNTKPDYEISSLTQLEKLLNHWI